MLVEQLVRHYERISEFYPDLLPDCKSRVDYISDLSDLDYSVSMIDFYRKYLDHLPCLGCKCSICSDFIYFRVESDYLDNHNFVI